MADINQLIASGGNVLNAQSLLGGVQRYKANELILDQGTKDAAEFDANEPVRAADRLSKLEGFEAESIQLGARAAKAHFDVIRQAETQQQKLSAMSDMLEFLDKRAVNIKERGGNPAGTINLKNAVKNAIANPTTAGGDLQNIARVTDELAEAN
ncbi:unnamed protein product, partial [marine sediment metagenome]